MVLAEPLDTISERFERDVDQLGRQPRRAEVAQSKCANTGFSEPSSWTLGESSERSAEHDREVVRSILRLEQHADRAGFPDLRASHQARNSNRHHVPPNN